MPDATYRVECAGKDGIFGNSDDLVVSLSCDPDDGTRTYRSQLIQDGLDGRKLAPPPG